MRKNKMHLLQYKRYGKIETQWIVKLPFLINARIIYNVIEYYFINLLIINQSTVYSQNKSI